MDNLGGVFLYLQIAESIRQQIANGEWKPGQKLPSVRAMATRWHCTLGTVNRAYLQLAQEGLLVGSRGGGTKVAYSFLPVQSPTWNWASLVNRAERFLLEAISSGHTPEQVELSLSLAISRWQESQKRPSLPKIKSRHPKESLRFVGSHDLLVGLLARLLPKSSFRVRMQTEYIGSLGGLVSLARGEADLGGIHLWDQATDSYNIPFVQRVLVGRRTLLLNLAFRSLGLIVTKDNPLRIEGLSDLARADLRFVNRQIGSGTRVWLEAQLKILGIPPDLIPGFNQEEFTHVGTARAVSEGRADVGLGIFAAAAAKGLTFLPLTQERYDLVLPEKIADSEFASALKEVIQSHQFTQAVQLLGGYDLSQTGQEIWIG